MSNLETALLDTLLDRYERSRGFKENRSQRRRVQLQMYGGGKTDFPAYDIEDSPARMAVNEAARRLAGQGVAELEWMRGQEGHILRRVALRPQALEKAYRLSGRSPLADTAQRLEERLRRMQQAARAEWVRRYLADELAFLLKNRRPPKAFPADAGQQDEWLAVLAALDAQEPEQPLLERVFSLRCWGTAKRLKSATAPACCTCCENTFRWTPRRCTRRSCCGRRGWKSIRSGFRSAAPCS